MGSGAGSVSPPLALSWGPPTAGLPPCLGGRRRGKAVPPVTSARILLCGGRWEPTIAGQVRSLGCGGGLWWRGRPSLGAASSLGPSQDCPRGLGGATTVPIPDRAWAAGWLQAPGSDRPTALVVGGGAGPRSEGWGGGGAGVCGQRCTPPPARAGPEQEGVCGPWGAGGAARGGVPPAVGVCRGCATRGGGAASWPAHPRTLGPRAVAVAAVLCQLGTRCVGSGLHAGG